MNQLDLVQQAIDYLVQTDLVVHWDFPPADPPSTAIRRLLAPYLAEDEIERTTAALLADYLVERLQEDFLPMDERTWKGQDRTPGSRRPSCHVVRGEE